MNLFTPRRLAALLLGSFALNLFLIGFVVARSWGGPPHLPPGGPLGPRELFIAAREVGAEAQVHELMRHRRAGLHERHAHLRNARDSVRAALVATPFDAARLRQALEGMHASTANAQSAVHDAFVELAERMTPEQRAAVAERMQHRRRR
jgi:Spy/CpxP family protein refolding chaperone